MLKVYRRVIISAVILIIAISCSLCAFAEEKSDTVPEGYTAIYTKEDFNNIRNDLDGKYILMNHIVFDEADMEEGWEPIGISASEAFTGVLDGNGYTVQGLKIVVDSDSTGYIGIIGYNKGTICNLGVVNLEIEKDQLSENLKPLYIGSIAGYNSKGTISKCYNTSNITFSTDGRTIFAGGICGYIYSGSIENCYNTGNISLVGLIEDYTSLYVSGIAPRVQSGKISNCYNVGMVKVIYGDCTVEYDYNGLFKEQKNLVGYYTVDYYREYGVTITYANSYVHSLTCEEMEDEASFEEFDFENDWVIDEDSVYPYPQIKGVPYVEADTNTDEFAGGEGTFTDPYIIKNKEHLKNVNNHLSSHFILDEDLYFTDDDFKESYWTPIGNDTLNQFQGVFDGNGHIISGIKVLYDEKTFSGAGVFGCSSGIIKNLGTVNGSIATSGTSNHEENFFTSYHEESFNTYTHTGGLVGVNTGLILNCYNSNDVHSEGKLTVGGLAGLSSKYAVIDGCFNMGNISAKNIKEDNEMYAAGICGHGGYTSGCINTGNVITAGIKNEHKDGINTSYTKLKNSYSVALRDDSVENISVNADTVYLSVKELGKIESYDELDFNEVWIIDENASYSYPVLKSVNFVDRNQDQYFVEGRGTIYSPYVIYDVQDLKNIGKHLYSYFVMANDIDLSETTFYTIGNTNDYFCGYLDGQGYAIKGFKINVTKKSHNQYQGLFRHLGGTVKNIVLEDVKVNVGKNAPTELTAGLFAGYTLESAYILNCNVKDADISMSLNSSKLTIGGIVGKNEGEINSSNYSGMMNVVLYDGTNELNIGNLTGENSETGRIVQTYSAGNTWIKSKETEDHENYFGGLVGTNYGDITDCFSTSNFVFENLEGVAEMEYGIGQMIGLSEGGKVKNCYSAGLINNCDTLINSKIIGERNDQEFDQVLENIYVCIVDENEYVDDAVCLDQSQMTDSDNFAGFDFESVWMIDDSKNSAYKYPQLINNTYDGTLNKFLIDECTVTSVKDKEYTGKKITPYVKVKYNGKILLPGIDYDVTYKNNRYPGTASIVITGKGMFEGTLIKKFDIIYDVEPADVSANLSTDSKTTGYDDIKVTWSEHELADGYVVYMKKENGKYVRKTYTSKTTYKINNLTDGTKYTFKIVPYVKNGSKKYLSTNYETASVYTLKKTNITSIKKDSSESVKIKWGNINGESGYQIKKMVKKDGKYSTVKTYTTTKSYKVVNAVKGKRYYYKVRAYKKVNGKLVYGPWSDISSYKL